MALMSSCVVHIHGFRSVPKDLREVLSENGHLRDVLICKTGNGGKHHVFAEYSTWDACLKARRKYADGYQGDPMTKSGPLAKIYQSLKKDRPNYVYQGAEMDVKVAPFLASPPTAPYLRQDRRFPPFTEPRAMGTRMQAHHALPTRPPRRSRVNFGRDMGSNPFRGEDFDNEERSSPGELATPSGSGKARTSSRSLDEVLLPYEQDNPSQLSLLDRCAANSSPLSPWPRPGPSSSGVKKSYDKTPRKFPPTFHSSARGPNETWVNDRAPSLQSDNRSRSKSRFTPKQSRRMYSERARSRSPEGSYETDNDHSSESILPLDRNEQRRDAASASDRLESIGRLHPQLQKADGANSSQCTFSPGVRDTSENAYAIRANGSITASAAAPPAISIQNLLDLVAEIHAYKNNTAHNFVTTSNDHVDAPSSPVTASVVLDYSETRPEEQVVDIAKPETETSGDNVNTMDVDQTIFEGPEDEIRPSTASLSAPESVKKEPSISPKSPAESLSSTATIICESGDAMTSRILPNNLLLLRTNPPESDNTALQTQFSRLLSLFKESQENLATERAAKRRVEDLLDEDRISRRKLEDELDSMAKAHVKERRLRKDLEAKLAALQGGESKSRRRESERRDRSRDERKPRG